MAKKRVKERPDRSLLFHILIWFLEILLVVLIAYGVSHLFFRTVKMQENSMEPTVSVGDTLLLDKMAYRLHSVKRGDVIAYRTTDNENEILHIKRVIGLPGETIQITNGQIMINGQTYREGRNLPAMIDAGIAAEPVTLADDEYFVLGDNRNGSQDSRYGSVGNVRNKRVAGKVWFRIWPIRRLGSVS